MTTCTCHPGNDCASAASCAAARRVEFGADMTTTQADALPEPELGYIKTDKSHQPAFSARQMRAALRPQAVPMTGKQARLLSREELAGCCGGCASNSAIETWMRRAIEKFCDVNGITAPAGGEG